MTTRPTQLFLLLLLLCLCVPGVGHGESSTPVLTVAGLGQPTEKLGGPWEFHTGDDPRWALPGFDDAGWERISADKGWGVQGHFAYQGFAWYRRHIDARTAAGGPLALFVPPVEDVYQVFWEGRPVGAVGRLPPHASWPNYPLPQTFDLGSQRSGVLAIRVWKAPLISYDPGLGGGLTGAPSVGSPGAIAALDGAEHYLRLHGLQFAIGLALLYGTVMIGSLGAWFQHRGQPLLLWLGLFALASVLQRGWWHGVFGFSYVGEAVFATVYQPLEDIATWFVLIYLLGLRNDERVMRWARRLAVAEIALLLLDGVAVSFWAPGWPQILDGIVSEVVLLPELFPVALVYLALRKRLPVSTWLVAGFALLTDLVLEVGSFLSQGDRFTHWTLWQALIRPLFSVRGNAVTLEDVAATCLLLSLVAAVYRSFMLESKRQTDLAREFHSAQELQRVLIPDELPAVLGYEVTSAYRPAQEVGGDFFQLIPQGGGSALLIVGDVSGKGLTAAMAVALIVGTIRTFAEQLPSPAEMLAGINRRLQGRLGGGFATCTVVRLGPDGGITVASAGHPPPFRNGQELEPPPALPLGISLDAEYEEIHSALHIGDKLLLYSDGLLEARARDGELFGFDRLRALAGTCADANEAAEAAIAFGQDDDITVVTVTRLRVGAEARTSVAAPTLMAPPVSAAS